MKSNRKKRLRPPEVCPVCHDEVPANALACPQCGADHNSGWREDADENDIAAPDDEFDYEKFVREEFGTPLKPAGIKTVWWITAMLLAIALLVLYLYGLM
ncbi:MAG: zinc ribbon domain-containing protein [Verrucomicrobiota bacterium]|nr:zinc ribbon domain-containing protein [Verrucomicrobiota bacterium]